MHGSCPGRVAGGADRCPPLPAGSMLLTMLALESGGWEGTYPFLSDAFTGDANPAAGPPYVFTNDADYGNGAYGETYTSKYVSRSPEYVC